MYDSIMCGYFCIGLIICWIYLEHIWKGKILLDYINLFCPSENKNHNTIMYKQFKDKCDRKKHKSRL